MPSSSKTSQRGYSSELRFSAAPNLNTARRQKLVNLARHCLERLVCRSSAVILVGALAAKCRTSAKRRASETLAANTGPVSIIPLGTATIAGRRSNDHANTSDPIVPEA
jgi:hypothetical protein